MSSKIPNCQFQGCKMGCSIWNCCYFWRQSLLISGSQREAFQIGTRLCWAWSSSWYKGLTAEVGTGCAGCQEAHVFGLGDFWNNNSEKATTKDRFCVYVHVCGLTNTIDRKKYLDVPYVKRKNIWNFRQSQQFDHQWVTASGLTRCIDDRWIDVQLRSSNHTPVYLPISPIEKDEQQKKTNCWWFRNPFNQLNSLSHGLPGFQKHPNWLFCSAFPCDFSQLWALQPCFSAPKLSSPTSTNRSVPLEPRRSQRSRFQTHRVFSPGKKRCYKQWRNVWV